MVTGLIRLALAGVVGATLWSLRQQARERRAAQGQPHEVAPSQPAADADATGSDAPGAAREDRPGQPDPATLTLP